MNGFALVMIFFLMGLNGLAPVMIFLIGGLGFKSTVWVSDRWLGFANRWTGLMVCVCVALLMVCVCVCGFVDGLMVYVCVCVWLCVCGEGFG